LWNKLQVHSEPQVLRNPVLFVSVSTSNPQFRLLYSQARELGKFLIRKLDFKMIASLYSSAMSPEIRIAKTGVAALTSNNFYLHSGKERDFLLFAGHSSPVSDEYEYGELVLSYAKKLGVKELVSLGARWTEPALSPLEPPKVLGFASDEEGVKRLKDIGITVLKSESAFYFANLIVPLSKFHDMRAYKLSVDHGEPSPHPKTQISFLSAISKLSGLEVDVSDLESQSKELAEAIQKAEVEGLEIDENGEVVSGGKKATQGDNIYR
jgi:proteasome assembly chaperone (PAC2) family protein